MTITVDSDLNGASPQFTLTCISTGGPATTVTWTRDIVEVIENTKTVLDDTVTAQYTHTLTVTEILEGLYRCLVSNKASMSSGTLQVQCKYLLIELQKSIFLLCSSFTTIWCRCVSEWTRESTNIMDSIRRIYCDWLHHLL